MYATVTKRLVDRPRTITPASPSAPPLTVVVGMPESDTAHTPGPMQPGPCSRPDAEYFELFHLFTSSTCETIVINPTHVSLYRQIMLDRIFVRHFLLDQMLAVAACHMSVLRPEHATHYQGIASRQQNRALAGFNHILANVNETNCLDVLLFSHLIALHVFWETFTHTNSDFGTFLDNLIACVRMLRGMNVVVRTWWNSLIKQQIGAIILQAGEQQNTPKASLQECEPLRSMIDAADLSRASIQICHDSLDHLQMYFDGENALKAASASTHKAFAWLITASDGYLDLLDQRRPEALALLAHFAVLLDRRNKSWVIRDAGSRLLGHIRAYLGKRWDPWLEWPCAVVAESFKPGFVL